MIYIFKMILTYYQIMIPKINGEPYNKQLSLIIDCLQYIIDTLKEEKS